MSVIPLTWFSWGGETYVLQVYTRSVIDPIPAPSTCADGDSASKAADRQKKKSKMTDEEIMDKLSKPHSYSRSVITIVQHIKYLVYMCGSLLISRNYSEHWRSQEEVHPIWKDWSGVSVGFTVLYFCPTCSSHVKMMWKVKVPQIETAAFNVNPVHVLWDWRWVSEVKCKFNTTSRVMLSQHAKALSNKPFNTFAGWIMPWNDLSSSHRASGTVFTAIDVATGQEVRADAQDYDHPVAQKEYLDTEIPFKSSCFFSSCSTHHPGQTD